MISSSIYYKRWMKNKHFWIKAKISIVSHLNRTFNKSFVLTKNLIILFQKFVFSTFVHFVRLRWNNFFVIWNFFISTSKWVQCVSFISFNCQRKKKRCAVNKSELSTAVRLADFIVLLFKICHFLIQIYALLLLKQIEQRKSTLRLRVTMLDGQI